MGKLIKQHTNIFLKISQLLIRSKISNKTNTIENDLKFQFNFFKGRNKKYTNPRIIEYVL